MPRLRICITGRISSSLYFLLGKLIRQCHLVRRQYVWLLPEPDQRRSGYLCESPSTHGVCKSHDFSIGILTSSNLANCTATSTMHGLNGLQYECLNLIQMPYTDTETGERQDDVWLMYISVVELAIRCRCPY
jgi:hypothetical protein